MSDDESERFFIVWKEHNHTGSISAHRAYISMVHYREMKNRPKMNLKCSCAQRNGIYAVAVVFVHTLYRARGAHRLQQGGLASLCFFLKTD